jgi:hypothetical protein
MAFNGTGTFVRLYNWVTDKTNSVPITASRMDAETDGIATGLSNCITKDGQTTISANIPFNSKKITGLAVGSARTDSINVGQVQDGQFTYLGTTGGSADAYTLSPNPSITAYVASMCFTAKIAATNATTTPYLQISGIGTPASDAVIKKLAADKSEVAVVLGDMVATGLYEFQRNFGNTAWILLNPENPISAGVVESDLIKNLIISTSVASNALTVALKTKAGNDPSASDPVEISFRSSTASSGSYNTRSIIAATSVVVSSGSTLGTAANVAANLYVYALDNAGTVEVGISYYLFPDNSIQSSTAEGGAGAADSATVLYSTTARTNVPVRLIGVINITEATAGAWVSNATTVTSNPVKFVTSKINLETIATSTASSSASIAFTNLTDVYSVYEFEFVNILPANNAVMLTAQYSTDNGSTWLATSYLQRTNWASTNDSDSSATNKTTGLSITGKDADANTCPGNTAAKGGINGRFWLSNPSNASVNKGANWYVHYYNSTGLNYYSRVDGIGIYTGSTTAINAIQFIFKTANTNTNNGNIASGSIILRGRR